MAARERRSCTRLAQLYLCTTRDALEPREKFVAERSCARNSASRYFAGRSGSFARRPEPPTNNRTGERMPLLHTEDKTPLEELKCKLRADELAEVKLYAVAIESSIDYVVSQALKRLTADKDFVAWKTAHPELSKQAPETPKTGKKSTPITAKPQKGVAA
jgi:hypothetical protein